MASPAASRIREDVLRDPRYPVHRIADKLLPFLRVLVEQFQPERVILFGSYACGQPDADSDVDLLVVKPVEKSRLRDKIAIRAAWWPLLRAGNLLSFDLMLADPKEDWVLEPSGHPYHDSILRHGLRVA